MSAPDYILDRRYSQSAGHTLEPITLAEAKAHARVDETADDGHIRDVLIPAARAYVEDITERQLITATWKLYLDAFPGEIIVPKPPLSSVTSVAYTDEDGNSQTLANTEYTVVTEDTPGRIVLAYQKSWPSSRDVPNAVTITYVAGYAATEVAAQAAVPPSIKAAMLMLVARWYEHREGEMIGAVHKDIEFAVNALLQPYRVFFPVQV